MANMAAMGCWGRCRPALIISVVTSGVVALLAGICYAELCVEFPVSGGAFSYVMVCITGGLRLWLMARGSLWPAAQAPAPQPVPLLPAAR
jgi:amino acid transporter